MFLLRIGFLSASWNSDRTFIRQLDLKHKLVAMLTKSL